jgi:bacillithiol system protein YtxJ
LLRYRSISDQISIDFDLHHESPQVLVIEGGSVTYHDSHFDIDYQVLLAYLQED